MTYCCTRVDVIINWKTPNREVPMATVSFDKSFVVRDEESIKRIQYDLEHPFTVRGPKRDYKAESKRGIELLKQRLSRSETY
jgi:hypothetical protein